MTTSTDLREAFHLHRLFAPDADADASDDDDAGDDDPEPDATDTAGEGGQDEDSDDGDDVDNPRIKKLSEEASKWRRQLRAAEDRIKQLEDVHGSEALTAENQTLRLRLAFERIGSDFADVEAAWKLAHDDLTTVTFGDDGTPDINRVSEIVGHVAKQYPYLVTADEPEPATRPSGTSGRPMNGKRKVETGTTDKQLAVKFPALRGHRRR